MGKAKAHPGQLGFAFEEPCLPSRPGDLAGLERLISSTVGTILNTDDRSRTVIAAQMSDLLDEEVTRAMLDAYASPAREGHKVPMVRFLALVAVTGRQDLFDPILRRIGMAGLVGPEVHTARIGQIEAQMSRMKEELRRLKRSAPIIRGEGR